MGKRSALSYGLKSGRRNLSLSFYHIFFWTLAPLLRRRSILGFIFAHELHHITLIQYIQFKKTIHFFPSLRSASFDWTRSTECICTYESWDYFQCRAIWRRVRTPRDIITRRWTFVSLVSTSRICCETSDGLWTMVHLGTNDIHWNTISLSPIHCSFKHEVCLNKVWRDLFLILSCVQHQTSSISEE